MTYQILDWDASQGIAVQRDATADEAAAIDARAQAAQAALPSMLEGKISGQIQAQLDAFAHTRRYDNVDSITKYVNLTDAQIAAMPTGVQSIVTRYRAECQYLVAATAQTWAAAEAIMGQAQAGNWPTTGAGQRPQDVSDIQSSLPTLAWPV